MNVRRVLAGALPLVGVLAGVGLLAFVGAPYWESARRASEQVTVSPGWILAASAALTLHYFVMFAVWRGCVRTAGASLSNAQLADAYIPALLARYVPGKVWSYGVRMAIARRAGISLAGVTGALGWEMLLGLTSAGLVALATLQREEVDRRIRLATLALTLVCIAAFIAVRVGSARGWLAPLHRRLGFEGAGASTGTLLGLGALYVFSWCVFGLGHWCLARAFTPIAIDTLPLVTGAAALAWAGGYLSVIMPAGLGVRDGLLAVFLAPLLGTGVVVLFVASARLLALALELLIFAGWIWLRFRRRSGQPVYPASDASSRRH